MKSFLRRHPILLTCLLLLLAGSFFLYRWIFAGLPPLANLSAGMTIPSTRLYDRNGVLLYDAAAPQSGRNAPLPFAELPTHCVQALVATEDANYWSHGGIDLVGVVRAIWINLRGGEVIAGGSTITQQTARLLLLDPLGANERTIQRKLKEMVLALQLSATFSKEDVLALYANQVYFGNLAYGLEAAAQAYFQKSARGLSLAECSFLAGIVQNASVYDPLTRLDAARDRQRVVLDLMVQHGSLTATEAAIAFADDLQIASTPYTIRAPHAVMTALQQLERDYPTELLTQGLEVTLTVDVNWTDNARRVVQNQLARINHPTIGDRPPANANNAALIALNPHTGEILTMLGSPDYFDAQIDGALNATLAYRQPGSTLKPFTYALAMLPDQDTPYTAATMLLDVQTPFITRRLESYSPGNYGLVEHGPVSLREALASSYNIPAVLALEHVGLDAFVQWMDNVGLHNLARNTDADLSITLGGGEVRLLDLAQAYSVFANGGYPLAPVLIQRVTTHDGQVLYDYHPPLLTQPILDARVAFLITDILSDNAARTPAFGVNNALNIGRPSAAKTGTTTDYRDNWVMGYTPDLVVGVWVGNADNAPMVDITGVTGAGPIYNTFIRNVLTGTPARPFVRPEGIVQAVVCVPSGLLPTPACPLRRSELFIDGTVPTLPDNFYHTLMLDKRSGMLADDSTPVAARLTQTFLILPQEARAWSIAQGIAQPPTQGAPMPDADQPLRFLDPDPYTIYALSDMIPSATQRLRLAVAPPPGTQTVTFRLNDAVIGSVDAAPWALWWQLREGSYALTATASLLDGTTLDTPTLAFEVVRTLPMQGSFTAP